VPLPVIYRSSPCPRAWAWAQRQRRRDAPAPGRCDEVHDSHADEAHHWPVGTFESTGWRQYVWYLVTKADGKQGGLMPRTCATTCARASEFSAAARESVQMRAQRGMHL
jgi:hypothetical protein